MRKLTPSLLGLIAFLLCWINLPSSVSDRLRSEMAKPFGTREFDEKEQLASVPAQVVYRDPSLWSSSLWVNVGEETNRTLGKKMVAKNSPVLADGALVGVVELVGKKQSRIRLITDSGLCPSVRVARGGLQNRELVRRLDSVLKLIETRGDLQTDGLIAQIRAVKESLGANWEDGYLAKGEVHGSSAPFWRSRSPMLKGIGFNFDFPDEGAPPVGSAPILREGDLLVTTGLDGVFPPGLSVGTVMNVAPRQPGAHSYEIDVRPTVSCLHDLQTIFILPPVGE